MLEKNLFGVFSFSAILLVIIFTRAKANKQKKKGDYFIFHRDTLLFFRVYLNLLNPHSYRSQTSFTLVLLRLQGSTKLQSKFIITDSNMQIPLRQNTTFIASKTPKQHIEKYHFKCFMSDLQS
jgi:hypothetical protein